MAVTQTKAGYADMAITQDQASTGRGGGAGGGVGGTQKGSVLANSSAQ
jgi:hypothetical protein